MTEARASSRGSSRLTPRHPAKGDQGNVVSRLFASLRLFISQIVDELRKVGRTPRSPKRVSGSATASSE